ncbi:50S ribosomal protein L11, partial [bacterium (Candidatus Howlettbacteria) CG_4_10_14_3_um_filter_37_10]
MAKKIKTKIKLQVSAGKATPAPPVGTALGPHGLNIMEFVNAFNEKTREMGDTIIPVEVTVYEDRSFTFITKVPPASELIRKALGIPKGSSIPHKEKVGKLTKDQLRQIAEQKMPDLNTD